MGTWSRAAGEIFLDWLAPSRGLCWIDVGCGTGSYVAFLCRHRGRCAPIASKGASVSMQL
jgi:precorrin-6B methylase 2